MAKENEKKEEVVITPSQYFDYIKGAKNEITAEALKDSYEVFVTLAEKYRRLGQTESLKKLCFLASTLLKEEKLIGLGITTYVYKDTVEDYIENVADKTVKIVELSRYMREIPDELVETVEKTREIFDEFYVVFTDYTGKEERRVEKERRDKDPILFGVFKNNSNVADRFYFIGDWVDEYCDLTLDKMVEQYSTKKGFKPTHEITVPNTSEELVELLQSYTKKNADNDTYTLTLSSSNVDIPIVPYVARNDSEVPKKRFFDRVRSVFDHKK